MTVDNILANAKKNRTRVYLYATCLLWIFSVTAGLAKEQQSKFENIGSKQGLSQASVQCIMQDSRGFIWIGTESGLNRYDGFKFTVFTLDARNPRSLSNGWVYALYEDSLGNIWVGTDDGLNRFNRDTESFIRYLHDSTNSNSISNNKIYSIHEDRSGNIWIGTDDGLNQFAGKNGTFSCYRFNPENSRSISDNHIRTILEDSTGMLWVGTDNGLNRLNRPGMIWTRFFSEAKNPDSLSDNRINSICEDSPGKLWVGTDRGLNYFDSNTGKFVRYLQNPGEPKSLNNDWVHVVYKDNSNTIWIGTNDGGLKRFDRKNGEFAIFLNEPNNPNSLTGNRIHSLYEDRSGVIWVGTYSGISKFNNRAKKFYHFTKDNGNPFSLSHLFVRSFYEEPSGILWVGTDGGGLNKYDPGNNRFVNFKNDPANPGSLSNDRIFPILKDSLDNFWVGTYGGGLNKFEPKKGTFVRYQYSAIDSNTLGDNRIRVICEVQPGVLWIGTDGGGISKFEYKKGLFTRYRHDANIPDSLSDDKVWSIIKGKSGTIWIATFGGGLNRFDPGKGAFSHYRQNPDLPNRASADYVVTICEGRSGILWLGTNSGLMSFDPQKETFYNYTESAGLPGSAVYGILEDRGGNLWVSTSNGLFKFNPHTKVLRNYYAEDGLQSNEFNGGSRYLSSKGEMFFGGINGFNRFYPESIKDNMYAPPVVITNFRIFNKTVSFQKGMGGKSPLTKSIMETKEIKLSYRDNVMSFEFAALHYVLPENNKYAYKMEGFDRDWMYISAAQRVASYTNLDPGEYTFRVKAANNDGVWNENGVFLKIIIIPPFWQTLWFRIITVIAILAFIFLGFKMRLRNIEAQKEKLEKLVSEQTQDLKIKKEKLEQEITVRKEVETELRKANQEAELARKTAEAASLAKGMFLSRMSHEIRTPLNSVIGFSDMLLDTEMNEEQVEFVRNITKSGEALLSLINEILDFSKIEAGQLTFQNIDFDLEITAFDVCHLTQPRLGNKPVEVFCRVDDNLPAFIKSDPTRLRQVFLNLISNAIKFTHEGEIELFVAVEEENEKQLKLHTTVRDTGIGIPADKLETVFELFQQVDGSITRKYGGTGLGLAICKQIARLMKGEIWVESELGKGSTFHFTAWVDKSEKVFVKQPQVEALAGKKALLVDDNENNLNILSHVVQLVGMRAEAIRSGGEVLPALQKAITAKDPFNVCILDIQMPDMSGYEVSRQVRKQNDPLIANLKLLAFSSSVTKRIKMFKESGFDGFLPKPIQRHTLITMLKRLLGEAGEEIESEATREKEVVITQHTLAEEAKHSVRILLAEDNPMNQKLAQYMLTKAGYQLEVANNGREAVEKYTADPERYDLIFMDVHMPEIDGLEATKVLRNRGYAEIPIIAMTADAMKEDREKCLQSGMNDYMSKPIKREEVFNMITKWVFKD